MNRREDYEQVEQQFGALARQHRKRYRLNQADVAQRMTQAGFPMHQTTLAKLEKGKRPLRLSEAVALSDLLGIQWMGYRPAVVGHGGTGVGYTIDEINAMLGLIR